MSTSIQCHDGFVFLSLYYAFINLLTLEFMALHSCSIHISNTLISYCIYMFKTLQKKKKKKKNCLLRVYWCKDNSIECLIITFLFSLLEAMNCSSYNCAFAYKAKYAIVGYVHFIIIHCYAPYLHFGREPDTSVGVQRLNIYPWSYLLKKKKLLLLSDCDGISKLMYNGC